MTSPVNTESIASSQSRWAALLLGLMMILTPALGVPSTELLQDTLKSGIVTLLTLGCTGFFLWQQRQPGREPLAWHAMVWLPLSLAAYAMASMAWSHAYLGAMEAARWLIFALLLWLGMNTRLDDTENRLLWGIHWGVSIASVWTAWQFWNDLHLFAQARGPASTFVNRNFFAEYAICALPYSLYLLLRTSDRRLATLMAFIIGFNIVALMMTGTRSALVGLLFLCAVLPIIAVRFRSRFALLQWDVRTKTMVFVVMGIALIVLGSIPARNAELAAEHGAVTPLTMAAGRLHSIASADEYTTHSFSVRTTMWRDTLRMISDNRFAGVGAGAWEVHISRYQSPGAQLETDFYAHNEVLQLAAEYGVVGWMFLALLLSYLTVQAWKTWSNRSEAAEDIGAIRAVALASLLMLLIVSNAGFPWRLAATCALFALSLSILLASDVELRSAHSQWVRLWTCSRSTANSLLLVCAIGFVVALIACQRAVVVERDLVRSLALAYGISNSSDPHSAKWNPTKDRILALTREAVDLNPHYRKITPSIGDEVARWGDWKNALWIWESVLESRPYVVALICNAGLGHLELGDVAQARALFERASALQPTAASVHVLETEILLRTNQVDVARQHLKTWLQDGQLDYTLARLMYQVGKRSQDWPMAIQALEYRIGHWPAESVEGWLRIGEIYATTALVANDDKALAAYQAALNATPEKNKAKTFSRIPANFQARLQSGDLFKK